ncbi:MAG: asparagine synthase-related protein [Solirubrobacteraceae bacterium]|jgi:asparagine synthase (glutamine-hydrolysing)
MACSTPITGRAAVLSAVERATGRVFGADGEALELSRGSDRPLGPRDAIERSVARALERTPCAVSFSGGLDSSTVLAVAVKVARARGLPEPVPVTLRFPGVADARETDWQELVIAQLGVKDWERVELAGEIDLLGELACAGLREHGLLWPANAHAHVPVFERARGGSVLTGLDGDGLFGGWRWQRAQAVLQRQTWPRPRDVPRVALALAPPSWRRTRMRSALAPDLEWITEPEREPIIRAVLDDAGATQPRRWAARVAWYARRRYLSVGLHSLDLLAADREVQITHPLADRAFLTALARDGGPAGYGTRRQAMSSLFSDLLPPALLERTTKAVFDQPLWGSSARAFAASWNGEGLDRSLIDVDALRAHWQLATPTLWSATVLQDAWLAAQAR